MASAPARTHRGPVHATQHRARVASRSSESSQSQAPSAAAGRGDVSRPPPPAPAYEFSDEPVPAASARTDEFCYSALLRLPVSPRSPRSFPSADADAATPPASTSTHFGERWRASVDAKGIARAAFTPSSDAVASRPGTSGSKAHGGGAFSSQAEGGQESSSPSPRSSGYMILASEAESGGNTGNFPLCTCRCSLCLEFDSSEAAEEEQVLWADQDFAPLRGSIEPEFGEIRVADTKEADPSFSGHRKYPLGSDYWKHFPATEELNPVGFYSPHPLWEGFAIPAKLGNKRAFHCVFCGKKFLGAADKGVKHMLRSQACAIPDVDRQILVDKLDAYCKRKEELLNQSKAGKHGSRMN